MADSRKRTLPEAPPDRTVVAAFREADAFVRPGQQAVDGGTSKTNTFEELAASLKSFKAGAAPLLEAERDKVLLEEELKGSQSALDANRKGFNELVKSGAIPVGANPHFRAAYQAQAGRIAADNFRIALDLAYEQSPIRKEDDPAKFQSFVSKFREDWAAKNMGGADPATMGAEFTKRSAAYSSELAAKHIQTRTAEIELEQAQATQQEAFGIIDRTFAKGAKATADQLTAMKDSLIANGAKGKVMTEALITAVITKAKEKNDPRILQILDHIQTGTGKLGDTAAARVARESADKAISHERERQYRLGLIVQAEARRKDKENVLSQGFLAMTEGRSVVDIARDAARRGHPEAAESLMSWHRSYTTFEERAEKGKDDPQRHAEILDDIHMKGAPPHETKQKIMDALNRGQIKGNTAKALWADVDKMEKGKQAFEMGEFKDLASALNKKFSVEDSEMRFMEKEERAIAGTRAIAKAREMWLDFVEKNPKVGPIERNKAWYQIYETIVTDPSIVRDVERLKAQGALREGADKELRTPAPAAPAAPATKPGAPAPTKPSAPTDADVEWLKRNGANPEARKRFDGRFGPGSADKLLKK